ncbi:MAG: glycosyltransferase family 4 protein [Chloroflexota bacterium]
MIQSNKSKRALVCSPLIPEFDRESGSRRLFHLVEFLLQDGWHVSYVAENPNMDRKYVESFEQMGVSVYGGFHTRTDQLIEFGEFDLAILAFWYIAERLIPKIRVSSPSTKILVDSIDLHFLRNSRMILNGGDGSNYLLDENYANEMTRELNAYSLADGVLTVSEKEARMVNDMINRPGFAHAVQDYEELAASSLSFYERRGIYFIGNFRHTPNIDAAKFLCEEIYPLLDRELLERDPIYIIGNAPQDEILDMVEKLPNVHITGWVPSVIPYIENAKITLLPLRFGAGTKRKFIQALMVGTPSISTDIGAEGLGLIPETHFILANTATEFAESIKSLTNNESKWNKVASAGREHIVKYQSQSYAMKKFKSILDSFLAKSISTSEILSE